MRVTNSMLVSNLNRNLHGHLKRLDRLHNQLSTGKRILKPSDGPSDAETIMNMESTKYEIAQYIKNGEKARTFLNLTDSVLDHMINIFVDARDMALEGATDSLGAEERRAIAQSVLSLLEDAVDSANSTYQGRYLFATNSVIGTPPFELVKDTDGNPLDVLFNGPDGAFSVEIAQGIRIRSGVDGKALFLDGNVFSTLIDLYNGLTAGTIDSDDYINGITSAVDNILEARADVGAKMKRFDLIKERYAQDDINMEALLSKVQGVDYAETISELAQEEAVYAAALKVGARVIQPSLIDYLR